jgi:hypothetical protein
MCLFLRERERDTNRVRCKTLNTFKSYPNLLKHERRPIFLEVYSAISRENLALQPKNKSISEKISNPKAK